MKITEALADIKTLQKRIVHKEQFILTHICLQGNMRDPLTKEGGSKKAVDAAYQAISDMGKRIEGLRTAINTANTKTDVTVNGITKTVSEWLVWRRDVYPTTKRVLENIILSVKRVKDDVQAKGLTMASDATEPSEVTVFTDETKLLKDIDNLEVAIGSLDGQLSLVNATVDI